MLVRMGIMYPDGATLNGACRIAVAAGRLDAALGMVWWHLAPDQVNEVRARAPANMVRAKIIDLASERLDEFHADGAPRLRRGGRGAPERCTPVGFCVDRTR